MVGTIGVVAATAAMVFLWALYLRKRQVETIYPWEAGLLYVDGRFVRRLDSGRHVLFRLGSTVRLHRVTMVEMPVPLGLVDALTSDRFSLRLPVTVTVRVTDPRGAVEEQSQYLSKIRLEIGEALIAEVAKSTLEELLASRADLGPAVANAVAGRIEVAAVTGVFISAVQLPPETRRLTTEIERAKLEGQAALERARSEHAALRALANAARLVKDNPDLIRLRTLQAVGQAGKGATIVIGQDAGQALRPLPEVRDKPGSARSGAKI